MQSLVKDLLDYSRLTETGETKLVDLNLLIKHVLHDLDGSIQQANAHIQIENLPELDGYETPLRLLYQNLISNAIKFSVDRPQIKIGADKVGGKWLFYVQDNGIGIDPQHHDKIFVIFQRLHLRSEFGGTGIGLAHCKKIVEMHGGIIWVESEVGKGSKFCFTLN